MREGAWPAARAAQRVVARAKACGRAGVHAAAKTQKRAGEAVIASADEFPGGPGRGERGAHGLGSAPGGLAGGITGLGQLLGRGAPDRARIDPEPRV